MFVALSMQNGIDSSGQARFGATTATEIKSRHYSTAGLYSGSRVLTEEDNAGGH